MSVKIRICSLAQRVIRLAIVLILSLPAFCQADGLQSVWADYITASYREEALKLAIEEANAIAKELSLQENVPIRIQDLTDSQVFPPDSADASGAFAVISTKNYLYAMSRAKKLNSVVRRFDEAQGGRQAYISVARKKYFGTGERSDTNAAIRLASQWLARASFDAAGLLRDREVTASTPGNPTRFDPYYIVDFGNAAEVQLLLPEGVLLDLTVNKPQYINRRTLSLPNRDALLQQTDDARMREMWQTTDAYKKTALQILMEKAGDIVTQLGLPETLPVKLNDLVDYDILPPYLSDSIGFFGTLSTEHYIFTARFGNKLAFASKNFRLRDDEQEYLESLKARYTLPKSKIDTNAAYALATQWLGAISVDLRALAEECSPLVSPWDLGAGKFVPLYTVKWKNRANANAWVAQVELLLPQHALIRLWVDKPEYVKGAPLKVQHREALLSITNSRPQGAKSH